MESPTEGAGPVLADFSLLWHEYEQHLGSTPMPPEVGGGFRKARFQRDWRWQQASMAQTRRGVGEEWPVRRSEADLAGGSGRYYWLQRRPRAAQERFQLCFCRLQELPRALQEASKRFSRGFRVEDAIRIPFGTHFGLQKESPGRQQSLESLQLS